MENKTKHLVIWLILTILFLIVLIANYLYHTGNLPTGHYELTQATWTERILTGMASPLITIPIVIIWIYWMYKTLKLRGVI